MANTGEQLRSIPDSRRYGRLKKIVRLEASGTAAALAAIAMASGLGNYRQRDGCPAPIVSTTTMISMSPSIVAVAVTANPSTMLA